MKGVGAIVIATAMGACATGGANGGAGGQAVGGEGGTTSSDGGGGMLTCDMGTACDNDCVDLMTDPANCGACGRTCIITNGEATCVAGACALAECDTGFGDCDGDVNTGCEEQVDCTIGGACPTDCGSTGLLNCADACAPTCDLPMESCNLLDDDCNTLCDDGAIAGCRIGVHRSSGAGHYYANTEAEISNNGYNLEALDYFHLYAQATGDLRPFFRCLKPNGLTFLTTATDCEIGVAPQATIGFVSPSAQCGNVPLYRLTNGANHFYTTSAPERDNAVNNLGYTNESIAGYVWPAP